MCETALPSHLDSKAERDKAFPDDDQYGEGLFGRLWRRYKKWSRAARAFGPRDVHWYHRFREKPVVLFKLGFGDEGYWRFEPEVSLDGKNGYLYLSRIQYWKRFHVALHWPFCITWNVYWSSKDVPVYPDKRVGLTLKQHFTGYIGFPRNSDKYYTGPTLSIGARFK